MATHYKFLPGESQGWGSLVGCRLWGRTESDTTEVTQQQHIRFVLFFSVNKSLFIPCAFSGRKEGRREMRVNIY